MNKKKLLALLMALVMTLTLVPVTAMADGDVASVTIGEQTTSYVDFADAIDAANKSDSAAIVTLLSNIIMPELPTSSDAKITNSMTIDGQSQFTISGGSNQSTSNPSWPYGYGPMIAEGNSEKTLNLKNLTIEKNGGNAAFTTTGFGSVALNNVIVNSTANAALYFDEGTTTLTNCNVTNTGSHATSSWRNNAIAVSGNGIVNIESGTYNSASYALYVYSSGGTFNITGGSFQGGIATTLDKGNYSSAVSSINIEGGSFTDFSVQIANGSSVSITGGTFDNDPSTYVSAGYAAYNNGDGTWTVAADGAKAKVGNAYYTTLQAAINAVKEAGNASSTTVTLLNNTDEKELTIDFTYPIVIDGQGQYGFAQGTYSSEQNTHAIKITVPNADVTFDGVTVGSNKIWRGINVLDNSAGLKLTVRNGSKIYAGHYPLNILPGSDNAVINVTGSQVIGYCALNHWGNNCTINFTNSVLQGLNEAGYSDSNDFATICIEADVGLSGTMKDKIVTGNVITVDGCTVGASSTNGNTQSIVVINGHHGANEAKEHNYNPHDNTVVFRNNVTSYPTSFVVNHTADSYNNNVVVYGGTYSSDVSAYCATGYKAVDNSNGTWTVGVDPDTAVAKIGNVKYATLEAAFAAVENGQTIELLTDVTLSDAMNVAIADKSVTLNLGNHTLTGRTNLKSGNLTIQNGTVAGGSEQALNVYGSSDSSAENYSVLNLASDLNVSANSFAVCMFGATATTNGYGAVVNTEATIHTNNNGAIFVSGNLGNNIDGDAKNVINVTGGSITSDNNCAIALNGLATVNVTGGTLTGNTAITVKRGTLNVQNGATIVANGVKVDPAAANNNGTEMTGAAISVTPTYSQYGGMAVNVSGGTITSNNNAALYVGHSFNSKNNKTVTFTNPVTLNVTGGSFAGKDGAVFVADAIDGDDDMPANFISGGKFSAKPAAAYIADGYATKNIDEKPYYYEVSKMTVEEKETPVTVDQDSSLQAGAATGDYTSALQTANVDANNAVTVSGVVLTADETVGTGSNKTTGIQAVVNEAKKTPAFETALNNAAKVEIEVDVRVTPKEYSETLKTFDLTPYATAKTYATVDATQESAKVENIEVTNDMIDEDQPIYVKLYVGGTTAPIMLLHVGENSTDALLPGDEASLTNFKFADGYCEFYVSHFSDIKALYNANQIGSLSFEGASLRRLVKTDPVGNPTSTVVNNATDIRLEYTWNLPENVEIVTSNSFFRWSANGGNTWKEVPLKNYSSNGANLVLTGVKHGQFYIEIISELHVEYKIQGSDTVYTLDANSTEKPRSVNIVCDKLMTTDGIAQVWKDYARFLTEGGTYTVELDGDFKPTGEYHYDPLA